MNKCEFSLAAESEDAGLRRLLKDNPVTGNIRVSFEREPNFFYGASAANKFRQVLICRDSTNREIIGIGMRSLFDANINGNPGQCGYLSALRINSKYRNATILARGYKFIKDLHRDGQAKLYLTTIISDNNHAKRMLTGRRVGLPFYEDFGLFSSCLIPLKRRRSLKTKLLIQKAKNTDIETVVEFLRRSAKQKQFYPAYTKEVFQNGNVFLRDFNLSDFFLAFRNNRLVGLLGLWDQRAYKQFRIRGYSVSLNRVRPFYNFIAGGIGLPKLPPPGTSLAFCYAFAIAVNDKEAFEELLTAAYNEAGIRKYDYLAVGLHARDPLSLVLRSFPNFIYKSNVYVVHWEDGINEFKSLDNRVPYLELASL